jgi:hypothetical protein
MDASRFDGWTRAVGTRAGRRPLLRGIVGIAVALGAGGVVAEPSEAKHKHKHKKPKCDTKTTRKCAKQNLACKKGKCVSPCHAGNTQCQGPNVILICGDLQDDCACSHLVEGGFTCAQFLHDADQNCPAASECERSSDCPSGEVCIDAAGEFCCNSPGFGLCQKQCKI